MTEELSKHVFICFFSVSLAVYFGVDAHDQKTQQQERRVTSDR